LPAVHLTRIEEGEGENTIKMMDKNTPCDRDDILAKMHGMELNDREEIIDALVTQEGF
jgi:hypothetical protein